MLKQESTVKNLRKAKLNFGRFKTFLLLFAILASTTFAQAQKKSKKKYEFNKETGYIEYKGQRIAKLVKVKADLIGTQKNFSLRSKEDEELLFVKYFHKTRYNQETRKEEKVLWFNFTFIESGGQLELKKGMGMTTKGLLKILAQNDLLTENGEINNSGLDGFLMKHNGLYLKDPITVSHSIVEVIDGKIYQDGDLLGKVIASPDNTNRIYHVYDKAGNKVCVATIPLEDPIEWKLDKPDGAVYTVLYEGKGDGLQILTYLASEGWFN